MFPLKLLSVFILQTFSGWAVGLISINLDNSLNLNEIDFLCYQVALALLVVSPVLFGLFSLFSGYLGTKVMAATTLFLLTSYVVADFLTISGWNG